jgi:three-Cys-motif partner protein
MAKRPSGKANRFGGDWTTTKLEVLAAYLRSYTTALKDKPSKDRPFAKAYIDAFAGTGYREARHATGNAPTDVPLLLPDLAENEPQKLLDGSALLALKTEPRFDHYLFIDRSETRCQQLELLKGEFPELASDIQIRRGEANSELQDLCSRDWRSARAVLFLDPYGMQVEWQTIAAVAKTKAIDTWILFPLGIGVNRLLTKSGEIPESWRLRLDNLLGTRDWFDEFYKPRKTKTLFGVEEDLDKQATTESIGKYFVNRLKTVFAAVSEKPRVLSNSSNCPLYLLCFAAGNERGAPIALRIANHLLTKGAE